MKDAHRKLLSKSRPGPHRRILYTRRRAIRYNRKDKLRKEKEKEKREKNNNGKRRDSVIVLNP